VHVRVSLKNVHTRRSVRDPHQSRRPSVLFDQESPAGRSGPLSASLGAEATLSPKDQEPYRAVTNPPRLAPVQSPPPPAPSPDRIFDQSEPRVLTMAVSQQSSSPDSTQPQKPRSTTQARPKKRRHSKKTRNSSGNGGTPPPPSTEASAPVPFFRRLVVLIVIGVLGTSAALLLFIRFGLDPGTVTFAPRLITIPLPTPSFEPTDYETPTEFLSGLPRADLTYGLVDYRAFDKAELFYWPGRSPEGWFLTYEDHTGDVMTVAAYQHYNEEEARAAFEAFAPPMPEVSTDTSPSPSASISANPEDLVVYGDVRVGDAVVGQSARSIIPEIPATEEDPGSAARVQIVWRNSTAVFVMTAPLDTADDLFLEYAV